MANKAVFKNDLKLHRQFESIHNKKTLRSNNKVIKIFPLRSD